jgi:hypothetical protein
MFWTTQVQFHIGQKGFCNILTNRALSMEYVRTGAAGALTRRSLGHHLLHPQNLTYQLQIPCRGDSTIARP